MMRRSLTTVFAVLASAAMSVPAWACGFEDPNGIPAQQVVLNLVYPNALYVRGAVDTALRAGMLNRGHLISSTDPQAYYRAAGKLRQFAGGLADSASSDFAAFSVVLMGPVLWSQFRPGSDGLVADIHTGGPSPNNVVMVTDVPVIAALVAGDITGAYAAEAGLVRFYGDSAEIDDLRKTLAIAFRPGVDLKGGAQARGALPTFLPAFR